MTITREWLAHHTGWENCWCGNTRASQRPDKRVRYIYRKYAGSSGIIEAGSVTKYVACFCNFVIYENELACANRFGKGL